MMKKVHSQKKKTLDDKYMTDFSDNKKIGIVHRSRWVFRTMDYVYWSQTRWTIEHTSTHKHMQTIIILRLTIF